MKIPKKHIDDAKKMIAFFNPDDYARLLHEAAKQRMHDNGNRPQQCYFCGKIIKEGPAKFSLAMLNPKPKAISKCSDLLPYVEEKNQRFAHGVCLHEAILKIHPLNKALKRTDKRIREGNT